MPHCGVRIPHRGVCLPHRGVWVPHRGVFVPLRGVPHRGEHSVFVMFLSVTSVGELFSSKDVLIDVRPSPLRISVKRTTTFGLICKQGSCKKLKAKFKNIVLGGCNTFHKHFQQQQNDKKWMPYQQRLGVFTAKPFYKLNY